ncbi:MAG: hypothetical protein ABR540_00940 [Acidimicrobiales bacterium]
MAERPTPTRRQVSGGGPPPHFNKLRDNLIWIGGHGERRLLPLAAKWADMWHGFGSVSDLTRKSRLLDRLIEEAGRDPASVGRSSNLSLSEPWDEVRRQADGLREAGFSYLVASWPAEGRPRMDEFVDRVLPELLEAS